MGISLDDLKSNLIRLNLKESVIKKSEYVDSGYGLKIPHDIFLEMHECAQKHFLCNFGYIDSNTTYYLTTDLWYAMLCDHIIWSNQPISLSKPEEFGEPAEMKNKFNRYTALLNKVKE